MWRLVIIKAEEEQMKDTKECAAIVLFNKRGEVL